MSCEFRPTTNWTFTSGTTWNHRQKSPILNDLEVPISQPGVSPPRNPGLVGDETTCLGPLILGGGV